MRMDKVILGTLLATIVASTGFGASKKVRNVAPEQIGPGTYTASIKAIVCGGCGEVIEKTMKEQPGIDTASVNQEQKKVTFTVKDGAQVKVAELQKALKAAADQMGMGADYRLGDIKKAS